MKAEMFSIINRCQIFPRLTFQILSAKNNSNSNEKPKCLKLFGDDVSPPVRFVKMTASELKVPLEFIEVDLFKRENLSESFTEINPLQKVPALVVGKEIMIDSHSIAMYLCDVYDKNNILYSKDPIIRSRINEMLFYNSCYLFPMDSAMFTGFFESGRPVGTKQRECWNHALNHLDNRLKCSPWLTGEKLTLADLCCMATISSAQLLVPPNKRHKHLNDWMDKLLKAPCFDVNLKGLEKLYCLVENMQIKDK